METQPAVNEVFPSEILSMIAEQVHTSWPTRLSNLRLVSKQMDDSVVPIMYRRMVLTSSLLSCFADKAQYIGHRGQTLELSMDGNPTLIGRSSTSSHHQLSTKKTVSRVHVKATYIHANHPAKKKVQIECLGWNGVRVHTVGGTHDLKKGQMFTSDAPSFDIVVEVQNARVSLAWPKHRDNVVKSEEPQNSWSAQLQVAQDIRQHTKEVVIDRELDWHAVIGVLESMRNVQHVT